MPVDPSISLDVAGGGAPSFPGVGPNAQNPLSMIEGVAGVQDKLNQLKLFQQTFQARQRAGQIMATAPDMATGSALMAKDPMVAAFAPELATQAAATNSALISAGGAVQQQGNDAFTTVRNNLGTVLQDPSQWDAVANTAISLASPAARPGLIKSMSYLQKALTDPMPDGSPVTPEEQRKRVAGWIIAAGNGAQVPQILPPTQLGTVGGATVPLRVTPPQGGVNGEAPGSVQQVPSSGGSSSASAGTAGEDADTFKLANGTPLEVGTSPKIGTGLMGQNALSPAQSAAATSRMNDWNGPELHQFQNSQLNQGYLSQMAADYDAMAKAGGMQVPGAGAAFRNSFTSAMNTLYQGLDEKPPFDPTAQAAAENMTKNTNTMGITLLTTLMGNQREAAQTVNSIQHAVPSINNSYLGGKLLVDSLETANQRNIDRRNFENAWQAKNQGNLQGADESFNKQAPMTMYTDKVLEKYGLTSSGFKDLASLENAARMGYLTPKQAADEAARQGFKLPGGK